MLNYYFLLQVVLWSMAWGYHPRRFDVRGCNHPLKYGSAWVVSAVVLVTKMPIGDAQQDWSGRYAPLAFIRSLPDRFRFGIGLNTTINSHV